MSLSRAALRLRNSCTIAASAIPSTSTLPIPISEIKKSSTKSKSLRKTPLPNQSVPKSSTTFLSHKPLPKTHGVPVAILHLRSHTSSLELLTFFSSFALRSAAALNLPTSNLISLPTKISLYTVPRSPFAHKKSQENFWKKEHKRAIKVYDGNAVVVERWLAYLRANAMGGVGMRVQTFTYKELGFGQKMVTSDGLNSPTSSAEISDADSIANLAAELVSELSIESATTESLEDMIAPIVQEGEIMLRGESPRLQITFQHVSPIASPIISVITPILTQVGLGSAPSISILYQHNSPIAATVEVESVIEKIIEGIPSVLGGGHRAEDAAGVAEKLVEEAIAKVESGPKK